MLHSHSFAISHLSHMKQCINTFAHILSPKFISNMLEIKCYSVKNEEKVCNHCKANEL